MSKLSKKIEEVAANQEKVNPSPKKKWTNRPSHQDQDTGETTAAGKAEKAKIKARTGVDQGGDEDAPAKKGFTKVSTGGKKPSAAAPKKERAERSSEPDGRKIKVLNKENPYREGSGRADSFNIMLKSKTVADYVDGGGKLKYIARWEAEGIISLA